MFWVFFRALFLKIMLYTTQSSRGIVTAPHHLAAQAGRDVLKEGGNAIEAMIATAAALSVVYPHMTGIGGDGFWLIAPSQSSPIAIEACGTTGSSVDRTCYHHAGLTEIPTRGPLAANTIAGTVGGWQLALEQSEKIGGSLALERLLEAAISYAEEGFPITLSQHEFTHNKCDELRDVPGFAQRYLLHGAAPKNGQNFRNPALGQTFRRLAEYGLDDFYRGQIASMIAADLQRVGSPLSLNDLQNYRASSVEALSTSIQEGKLYNFPPPTQGLVSLLILTLFDRLRKTHDIKEENFSYIHGLVEATKQAFLIRDRIITDPAYMKERPHKYLQDDVLERLTLAINMKEALPWPSHPPTWGDTIWAGAADRNGLLVSFIQSIYFEFGSGVVLPETGITWQNRGSSFRLNPNALNAITPGRKPFHTLNPAMAFLNDGRVMAYGTMGGEGQPQTQAAIFSRYAMFGQELQQAITAPRWLLGRTWGDDSVSLKLENRFDPVLVSALERAGHQTEQVPSFTSLMGHAGAVVWHPEHYLEAATDPRSDGGVAAL